MYSFAVDKWQLHRETYWNKVDFLSANYHAGCERCQAAEVNILPRSTCFLTLCFTAAYKQAFWQSFQDKHGSTQELSKMLLNYIPRSEPVIFPNKSFCLRESRSGLFTSFFTKQKQPHKEYEISIVNARHKQYIDKLTASKLPFLFVEKQVLGLDSLLGWPEGSTSSLAYQLLPPLPTLALAVKPF